MAKQVSFDMFATMLYRYIAVKTEVQFCAAFLASILACLASHPGDVILTATYKQGTSSTDGFPGVVASLYNEKGLNGFFAGLTARFFHVGAIITSQLVLYDVIKQLLGLPATGTH
jgi:solute carrier family 25 (mitochondrial phosphate transporter), member 3